MNAIKNIFMRYDLWPDDHLISWYFWGNQNRLFYLLVFFLTFGTIFFLTITTFSSGFPFVTVFYIYLVLFEVLTSGNPITVILLPFHFLAYFFVYVINMTRGWTYICFMPCEHRWFLWTKYLKRHCVPLWKCCEHPQNAQE